MGKTILALLGGNSIKKPGDKGTAEEQFENCVTTSRTLTRIMKNLCKDWKLVISHGNGPQVGNLLIQQTTSHSVPSQPLDILVSMTQGQIGYMMQQSLMSCLRSEEIYTPVCSVVTQVLVDKNDPEFFGKNASKPVGDFLTEEEVTNIRKKHSDYIFKKVKPVGERVWRRTVPSPKPIEIVEHETIRKLVESGIIVIACGGGGVPVIQNNGKYNGVEAVVDKDLAGEKLARVVKADVLLILTDVEKIKLNFGKPNEKEINRMTVDEALQYLQEGHFLKGSMEPKIQACIRFLQQGGEKAIITSLDKGAEALTGKTGTTICRN